MKRFLLIVFTLITAVTFASCGGGGGTAPGSTATVKFSPAMPVVGYAAQLNSQQNWTVNITVNDPNGNPIVTPPVDVQILFHLTTPPTQTMLDNAGLQPAGLVTLSGGTDIFTSPITETTNNQGNVVLNLLIEAGGGLVYTGELDVYDAHGAILGNGTISVTSQ